MTRRLRRLAVILTILLAGASLAYVFRERIFDAAYTWMLTSLPSGSLDALRENDALVVYALEPEGGRPEGERFYNYPIVCRAEISDAALRAQVAEAVVDAVGENAPDSACFVPRHGVRATRGDETVDFLICFECARVEIYAADRRGRAGMGPRAQALLDAVLSRQGKPNGFE